jgi:hypothetical protein
MADGTPLRTPIFGLAVWLGAAVLPVAPLAAAPQPPADVRVADHPWDGGTAVDVSFRLSPDDYAPEPPHVADQVDHYAVLRGGEVDGVYREVATVSASVEDAANGRLTITVGDLLPEEPYYFRVVAVAADGSRSSFAASPADQPAIARQQWFDGSRFWLLVLSLIICGSVVVFIGMARAGRELYVRPIAGLEAIEEAVGRATEMGRSCLFVPGVQDMNEIQTIAGLTILSRVAQRAAEYDARLEVPTSRSLVMTAARETVQAAFLAAGRPDAYDEDAISYITDEQFGYVAYLAGQMVREKPAACFYLGSFFAESLILAETGNAIGAIQVAGTAQPAQLPFFVAACDYTLIGEEFFAASAYLSRDPDQLGSLKGQDVGKLVVAALMIAGVALLSIATVTGQAWAAQAADYLQNVILASG